MPLGLKNHLRMTLFVILFAGKLRRCLSRFRKRRELIQEWLDLETNNIACIAILTQKVITSHLPPAKAQTVLHGLEAIYTQSHSTTLILSAILAEKGLQFGSRIIQICGGFDVYESFLRKHAERQAIMKEMEKEGQAGRRSGAGEASDRVTMEETAQKIVFRTYQLSLLVGKYLKCLRTGNDLAFFHKAIAVLTNVNKKHDHLLRQEQKLKERQHVERIMDRQVLANFIYSQKCHWHKGQATLHVFQTVVAVEAAGKVLCVDLDKYCSVFSKSFDGLHMGCLVAKNRTLHLIFAFGRQLGKFLRVLDNLIHVDGIGLSSSQATAIFPPFLAGQVVDFRESRDLRGNSRDEFTIIFSAIYQETPLETDQMRNSMRESGLNWTEVDFCAQPQQLNETVTLSIDDLLRVKEICEKEYGLMRQLPQLMNFSGQASDRLVTMLQWQSLLNEVLRQLWGNIGRSRTAINNPILLLKHLQVTDVFLESALSRDTLALQNNQRFHCRLCACLDASSLQQFFRRRLRFLARKYAGQEREYCYYIFQKIREEACKISPYELTNCMQLMAWRQMRSGHIDYSFRKLVSSERRCFVEVAVLGVEERSFEVEVNAHTLVNEVIDQICLLAGVPALFGYRLAVCFQDRELLLRHNELVFPLVDRYNIKYQKSYSPTLFSKFKSFGRLLQFSENGLLVLKQVIFYPLGEEEVLQREWQQQYEAYQFKCEKLIGLSRDCRLDLIVLLAIRGLINDGKELPTTLSHRIYQKYVPNSLEEEVEDSKAQLQKLYQLRRGNTRPQICGLIEAKLSASAFYRSYVWEMRVCEMSEGLSSSHKKVKSVMVGVSWTGMNVLTLNERAVFRCEWAECALSLGTGGLRICSEGESITVRGLQLYQTYSLCREYKGLSEQAALLKAR